MERSGASADGRPERAPIDSATARRWLGKNPLRRAADAFVGGIKINRISREARDGRAVWVKRRRGTAAPILWCANGFFRLARARVQALAGLAAWRQWEAECFTGLHGGEGFRAWAEGRRAVAADELPGVNLTDQLDGGTLTPAMTAAAARELRRAHAWSGAPAARAWSHGDPHAGNFILDAAAGRARLIDFEVMHDFALPPVERHADDLLVFLQDVAGRIAAERWLPCASAFVEAYAEPAVAACLAGQLVVPARGAARLWWQVRASFLPAAELRRRIGALRDAISN